MPAFNNRLGEITQDKYGTDMKIIEYVNSEKILVEFQDDYKYKVWTDYHNYKIHNVKNLYRKSVYGVGYLGQGNYAAVINKKMTKPYSYWKAMMQRCYCNSITQRTLAYEDIIVCKEWHNYQNFAKWFEENYYEVETEQMCLDKDIIGKHKHIYSPKTCVFVPKKINGLFIFGKSSYTDLPVGVYYDSTRNRYVAQYGSNKSIKHIGQASTPHEAFLMYKQAKENQIKTIAQEYKNKIPNYIFNALIEYEVDEYY